MIFSDPEQTNKFKVHLEGMRVTKKGSLKIKASDPNSDIEPGYMTFNPREVAAIKKALGIK